MTVTSVTLNLAYDPNLLTVSGVATPGLAVVTYSSPTGIVLGHNESAIFATLTALVPSTAGYGAKEILDLQNIQINGGSITALDDAAVHVSGFLGDVTGDGIYTGLDAQRISRVVVGLDPGFRQWVLADPLIVGDVSGDNVLTGLDALQIAREAVGITQANVPVLPAVTPGVTGPDPVVSIGQAEVRGQRSEVRGQRSEVSAKPQAEVVVPVNLDPGAGRRGSTPPLAGLDSVNLVIAYDTSRVDVVSVGDVVRGSLTQTFDNFTVNVDRAAGIIYISGYRGLVSGGVVSGGVVSGGVVSGELSGGSLALITFHVKPDAPAGAAIINLMQNAGSAWTALGGTDAQGNDFLFDLEPRPSNAAGDALDGCINVLSPVAAGVQANAGLAVAVVGDETAKPAQRERMENGGLRMEPALCRPLSSILHPLSSIFFGPAAGVGVPVPGDEQSPSADQRGDSVWLQMGDDADAGSLSILTSGLEVSSELFRVGAGAWQPSDDVWLDR